MAGAALIGVEHQLERYNEAASRLTHGADISGYLAPIFLVYVAFNFVPTAVALARHYGGARRIFVWNAAAPSAVLLVSLLFLYLPGAERLSDALVLIVVAGGFLSWVSTMVDAATGSTEGVEEG